MKNFVEVPIGTLSALKNMLFNNEGVDLSSIIEDLSKPNDDLTAINIALTYKGFKPDIDSNPRYYQYPSGRVTRYDFIKYSLILDKVFCTETECTVEEGQLKEGKTYNYFREMSLSQWLNEKTEITLD